MAKDFALTVRLEENREAFAARELLAMASASEWASVVRFALQVVLLQEELAHQEHLLQAGRPVRLVEGTD